MSINSGDYPALPGWLAIIPGYAGYHAKEQRRLADRALREELARRVGDSVQQLQRLSAALARARRFADLGPLDTLTSRLLHLRDRLLTVPEGYRGLFEQERVDEAALDQVIAFDRALAAGVERLSGLVAALSERTPAPLLDSPPGVELTDLTERLHARLDARGQVFTSGQALAPAAALAVLQEPAAPAPPLTLKPGDAVSYASVDYIVDAVVTYQGDRAWTEYRLRDASAERWLVVAPAGTALLTPTPTETATFPDEATATVAGRTYQLRTQGQATASLIGPSGQQRNVPVSFRDYQDAAGGIVAVRDWGAERRIAVGETIDAALLSVFPRT